MKRSRAFFRTMVQCGKKIGFRIGMISFALSFTFLLGCKDDPVEPIPPSQFDFGEGVHSVYVLNQGIWNQNDASLTYVNKEGVVPDFFTKVNKRGLGDVGNDMKRYGGKLYIIVNNSNTLEVLDLATANSIKRIPLGQAQPRQLAFSNGFVYVSSFSGAIYAVDTLTLESSIVKEEKRMNFEGIHATSDQLFVCNSGALNYPYFDSVLLVYKLPSYQLDTTINIGLNPSCILPCGKKMLAVSVLGDYQNIPSSIKILDKESLKLVKQITIPLSKFTVCGSYIYVYHYDYLSKRANFTKYDWERNQVVSTSFLKESNQIKLPYGIEVNPINEDIYVLDAVENNVNGTVYCFDKYGSLKFTFEVGLYPSQLIFMNR